MSEIRNLVFSSPSLISLYTALTWWQMCKMDSILKFMLIFSWDLVNEDKDLTKLFQTAMHFLASLGKVMDKTCPR